VLLLICGPASARAAEQTDPRIRTITYDANQVVRLQVPANFHVAVLFNEQVENVALGNSDAWQVTLNGSGDALFVKPAGPTGPTNMTVITSVRVYSFELLPAYGSTPETAFTVQFRHTPTIESDGLPDMTPRLGSYRISGSRRVRPVAVSDDGVRTLIEWGPSQPIPAVFALDDYGAETLVEGHMRNGLYVIDAVNRALVFRLDRQIARATRNQPRARR
jgi:type IV secretion system protein VirB9